MDVEIKCKKSETIFTKWRRHLFFKKYFENENPFFFIKGLKIEKNK
jgi:hypothetical protein